MVGIATYRFNVYRGNSRDGYCFHQQSNDKRAKANEDKECFFFVVALNRAVLNFHELCCFLSQVSDFTRLSIEVIENARFQSHKPF